MQTDKFLEKLSEGQLIFNDITRAFKAFSRDLEKSNQAFKALLDETKNTDEVSTETAKAVEEAEEPKTEEPKAEEPKAEEPKAEEPKAEEPKAEEPKAEEPLKKSYTYDVSVEVGQSFLQKFDAVAFKKLIGVFGAKRLSELNENDRNEATYKMLSLLEDKR